MVVVAAQPERPVVEGSSIIFLFCSEIRSFIALFEKRVNLGSYESILRLDVERRKNFFFILTSVLAIY